MTIVYLCLTNKRTSFSVAKVTLQSQMSIHLSFKKQNSLRAWNHHPSSFILYFVTSKLFSLFWVHFWYYLVNILNINIYSPKFGSFQKGAQIDSRYPIVCCCLYLCLYTCKYVQYILVYRVHYWWMIKILFLSLIKTSLKMETKPQVE